MLKKKRGRMEEGQSVKNQSYLAKKNTPVAWTRKKKTKATGTLRSSSESIKQKKAEGGTEGRGNIDRGRSGA